MASSTLPEVSGLRKAAVLMVLLGDKVASSVYRHLSQDEVEQLTREIAEMDVITHDLALQVLDEFNKLTVTQDYLAKGGVEYAQRLLVGAFGEQAAKDLLNQVLRTQEVSIKDLEAVQRADPVQLAKFLEGEHPQTVALLVAHLPAKSASALLKLLPESMRAEVVQRLAKLRQFSPEMVQRIIRVLRKKIVALGTQNQLAYGGIEAVGDLLNRLDQRLSHAILATIEQQDAELALAIRNTMFTFDDFLVVPEVSIRELLGLIDKKTLAIALKGASPELKSHFTKTLSSRAAEMLTEDMEALGVLRARDVQQAQQEIVAVARKLEAEGKIVLKNEAEDAYIV
jgi:flagellar motor switch protein FliG